MDKEIEVSTKNSTSEQNQSQIQETEAVHFSCKGWKSKALQVFDSGTNNILYTVDTKFRQPNLIFKHGDQGEKFGSTTYHITSTKIDLDINNQSVEMRPTKILSSSYTYKSAVLGNKTLTWKSGSGWKEIDFVLLDEQSLPVAKCSAPYLSSDFSGKIEFLTSRVNGPGSKEEILIGAMSLIYLTITTYYAAVF